MVSEVKITKEKIIKDIAKRTHRDIASAKEFYNELENMLSDYLSCVDKDTSITIKLFNGITLNGTYIPEHINLRHDALKNSYNNVVKSKIKPKFNISRQYCKKLNEKHK